jgi:hypothetical protein
MQIDDFRSLAEVEDSMWYFHALNRRMLLPWRNWPSKMPLFSMPAVAPVD